MSKTAMYLIDDAKYHIAGIATSWDYDNRVDDNQSVAFPDTIDDNASGYGVRVKRDFLPQEKGNLVLEMFYVTYEQANGVSVKICSASNKELFEYHTEDDVYYFNGIKTDCKCELGNTRIKVNMNLDDKTCVFSVNGKKVGSFALGEFENASKIILGTTGKTTIKIRPVKNKLYLDFIANETLVGTEKYIPEPWVIDGDFEIRPHVADNPQMNYTYFYTKSAAGKVQTAYLPIEKTDGDLFCEGYFLLPKGDDGLSFSLKCGDDVCACVYTKDNKFFTSDGDFLRAFTSNVWQLIRFETKGNKLTVKIDGKVCGNFDLKQNSFDGIEVKFAPKADAELLFCDIVAEYVIDYPDYCPEPKAVRHPKYDIGMNICNMWREGHHFGWDRITHFTDNTPLIGPYDEGTPEVADWEIKFMTEHGITFQHFCWYCPDAMIDFPIKRSRMDSALRDGFMNARYSDKMKFIIMWENNGYRNTNPENFKEYVWKYWCEYFFTDPRYLVIDNKPIVTLWSFKFVDHWGGHDKAKEVIAFMKEDIKRYGFDDLIIMSTYNEGLFESLSEYSDGVYSYHFHKMGYMRDYQKTSVDKINAGHDEKGLAPYMQTVSVGFNCCPWHGAATRVPLISLEDFEEQLRYVKKRNDESKVDAWHTRTFMMSTWNEYGEGTYMMPAGLHGFGYLDKIRKVFIDENGQNENLLPDENQMKRICTLRVPGRSMIRRLGFEKSDKFREPNVVVKKWDMSNKDDAKLFTNFDEHVNVEYTNNSVRVTPVSEAQHYSLVISDSEKGVCFSADGTYIRVRLKVDSGAAIRVAYLTDTSRNWKGDKCSDLMYYSDKDGVVTFDFFAAGLFKTWLGKITDIRIDNMNSTPFEVLDVSLMKYISQEDGIYEVFVGEKLVELEFFAKKINDEIIVSLDPGVLAFRRLKLYQEYRNAEQMLTVASKEHTVVFTENAKEAVVDGKKVALRLPMTLRDGLPTLSINELCDLVGYTYKVEGKKVIINA